MAKSVIEKYSFVSGLLLVLSAVFQFRSAWGSLSEQERLHLASMSCEPGKNATTDPSWRAEILERTDGKHIVLVGDSITRYQYLELAFYVIYGHCPNPNSKPYILSERNMGHWGRFYHVPSSILNVDTPSIKTREVCMCSRRSLESLEVIENRLFTYEDNLGHKLSISYLQYFNEWHAKLQTILHSLQFMKATDVMLNFGAWHWHQNSTCGYDGDPKSPCTSMPVLCKFFHAKHSYRLWWLTTTPQLSRGKLHKRKLRNVTPKSHPLNVAAVCKLQDNQIIDRYEAVRALVDEPNHYQLFLDGGRDRLHFGSLANHAFNKLALLRIPVTRSKFLDAESSIKQASRLRAERSTESQKLSKQLQGDRIEPGRGTLEQQRSNKANDKSRKRRNSRHRQHETVWKLLEEA